MPLSKKISLLFVILLITASVWLYYNTQTEPVTLQTNQALNQALLDCDGITERAASHLVAVVEFQKLEIAGRKARVFKLCMNDHGYIENIHWLAYITPLAEKTAKESNISVNEALENERRAHMTQSTGEGKRPTYWVTKEIKKP